MTMDFLPLQCFLYEYPALSQAVLAGEGRRGDKRNATALCFFPPRQIWSPWPSSPSYNL